MQTKIFQLPELAVAFVNDLHSKGYTIDIYDHPNGSVKVNWIMPKKFVNCVDNIEYNDEVWVKEDGTMINCQDLDLEHARNIIRMVLRNSREQLKLQEEIIANLRDAIESIEENEEFGSSTLSATDTPRVLH